MTRTKPPVALAVAVDAAIIVVFAAGGTAMHHSGGSITDLPEVALPFLAGGALGWVVVQGWRRPLAPLPTGLSVGVFAWGVGQALRAVLDQGNKPAFMIVSAVFFGAVMIGWRAYAQKRWNRRSR